MRFVVVLARLDSEDRREEGIAVVDGASAPHLALLDDGVAGVRGPALAERLLVHVAVHEHAALFVARD